MRKRKKRGFPGKEDVPLDYGGGQGRIFRKSDLSLTAKGGKEKMSNKGGGKKK